MSALRLLLMVTWAAWIWMELVAVLLPTVMDLVRRRGHARDAGSVVVLLGSVGVGFVVATRLARLDAGALPGPPEVLAGVGLVVMWVGLALRAWSIQHLGGLFSAVVVLKPNHRLVTTGPYRYVRHPSYSGALLAALGFGVALGHWTSIVVLVLTWAIGLTYRIRVEEAAMLDAFGPEYAAYRARTRWIVPRVL